MKTVGLTGGIAAGKSTVAALLRDRSVPVLDADRVARDVVAVGTPGLAAVVARFGDDVLLPDGALDRKALGRIVMADPAARRDLEAITHPRIFAGIRDGLARLEADGHPAAVVEAAHMVETGSFRLYDALIVVAASPDVQRERLMAREGMDAATAERWMAAQLPLADKVAHATEAIWNDGDLAALEAAVEQAWARLAPDAPAQV